MPVFRLIPLFWLAVSVLFYLLGTHIEPTRARLRLRVASLERWRKPLLLATEALYYLGLPYLALLRGDLLPRYMGLSDLNWVQDIGLGTGLMAAGLALVLLAFRYAQAPEQNAPSRGREEAREDQQAKHRPGWSRRLWGAITLQVHWAFYRAVLIQALGDVYWGTFASLIPLSIEKLLEPTFRRRLLAEDGGLRLLSRLVLLTMTTTIYLFVRNLPLLITFHWLAEGALAAATRAAGRKPASPLSTGQ